MVVDGPAVNKEILLNEDKPWGLLHWRTPSLCRKNGPFGQSNRQGDGWVSTRVLGGGFQKVNTFETQVDQNTSYKIQGKKEKLTDFIYRAFLSKVVDIFVISSCSLWREKKKHDLILVSLETNVWRMLYSLLWLWLNLNKHITKYSF